jgi:hypothetical protein
MVALFGFNHFAQEPALQAEPHSRRGLEPGRDRQAARSASLWIDRHGSRLDIGPALETFISIGRLRNHEKKLLRFAWTASARSARHTTCVFVQCFSQAGLYVNQVNPHPWARLSRRNVRKLIDVSTGSMRRMNIE